MTMVCVCAGAVRPSIVSEDVERYENKSRTIEAIVCKDVHIQCVR